jgi:hypothetical protein
MQFGQLERRSFITLLAATTAAAWPFAASAQQTGKIPPHRISWISNRRRIG